MDQIFGFLFGTRTGVAVLFAIGVVAFAVAAFILESARTSSTSIVAPSRMTRTACSRSQLAMRFTAGPHHTRLHGKAHLAIGYNLALDCIDCVDDAERIPAASSSATPRMVVPPGEHTASFIAPGCMPVAICSLAVPATI